MNQLHSALDPFVVIDIPNFLPKDLTSLFEESLERLEALSVDQIKAVKSMQEHNTRMFTKIDIPKETNDELSISTNELEEAYDRAMSIL